MSAAIEWLDYWLADYYAVSTCVLLAAIAIVAWLKQPARRLAIARAALLGLLALLVLGALPSWPRTGLLPASVSPRPQHQPAPSPSPAGTLQAPPPAQTSVLEQPDPRKPREGAPLLKFGEPARHRTEAAAPAMPPPLPASASAPALDWTWLAGRTFLAGAGLMLAWLALGSWQAAALRRRGRRAPEAAAAVLAQVVGEGRMPELLVCDGLRQPVAVGVLRPAILLPQRFVEGEARLEAVLAHEWAHIQNRDLWLIALLRLLLPVLYAHPAYWWLRRQVRDDQEALADASAAGIDGREDYAAVLLSWSRISHESPRFAAGGSLALFERPSQIKWRIIMLLDRTFQVEPTCPALWRLTVRAVVAAAVLGLSLVTLRPVAAGDDPAPPASAKAEDAKAPAAPGDTARLLDPAGKPFGGAAVYLSVSRSYNFRHPPTTPRRLGTTRPDGSFEHPQQPVSNRNGNETVVVMADGYGPAFADPSVADGAKVLKLVKDDVPIRGRVLDIQGRPVRGATVQLVAVLWHPSGSLDEWLGALKTRKAAYPVQYEMLRWWTNDDIAALYPPIKTDREGRFTLKGIGRERIASLLVSGPGIETRFEYVATRELPTLKVPDFERQNYGSDIVYYGAELDLVAGPDVEVAGTVTDQDTKKPLAGVTVETAALFGNPFRTLSTTTDAQGRYRLPGIPPRTKFGDGQEILASVSDGPPFLPVIRSITQEGGARSVALDITMKRGVWARGRVVDGSTGKGVRASLSYYILEDNPFLKTYPRYGTIRAGMPNQTEDDGSFKLIVMPGRGVLGARAGNEHYRLGTGLDKVKDLKRENLGLEIIKARPSYLVPVNYHTLVAIDPKEGDESVTCEIVLDRGKTMKGTILDPDGKPLAGARVEGLEDHFRSWSHAPLASAEFEVHALGAKQQRLLLFYHEARKLAGACTVEPDTAGPIRVTLEPCGTVTGRLVDSGGLPLGGTEMTCNVPYGESARTAGSLPTPVKTDKDGRFRAEGLVPGRKYTFHFWRGKMTQDAVKDVVIARGESKDLGDVTVNPNE